MCDPMQPDVPWEGEGLFEICEQMRGLKVDFWPVLFRPHLVVVVANEMGPVACVVPVQPVRELITALRARDDDNVSDDFWEALNELAESMDIDVSR